LHVLQAFCGFELVAGQPPVAHKYPCDDTLSSSDGPDLATRFLDWDILNGHPGLKVRNTSVAICCSIQRVPPCGESIYL
jgi:hypothetical protein